MAKRILVFRQQGFTLIEMVMALVILGIISLAIGGYIQLGTEGYISTVSRDRFQAEARFILEKMTREIRHAAPNSIQVNGRCLSFYPIRYAGFYQGDPSTTTISIVPTLGSAADWLAIPKRGNLALAVGLPSASSYQFDPNHINQVTLGKPDSGSVSVVIDRPLAFTSPAKRAYVYGGSVSYCQAGNLLMRNDVVLGEHIKAMDFDAAGAGLENNGMVHIGLIMNNPKSGETFSYDHTVQVMNVL
ncbi:PilW family protein [Photobacterium nomapromontoriensis]|uniref:PilW family protein n=1 Tax=Photobacterium nomapromontoriensis TaxID=2910237 RepID=UPI003D10FFFA